MDETARSMVFFFHAPCASFCALASGRREPTGRMSARGTTAYFRCLVPFLIINKNGVCSVSFGCDSRLLSVDVFALNCRANYTVAATTFHITVGLPNPVIKYRIVFAHKVRGPVFIRCCRSTIY